MARSAAASVTKAPAKSQSCGQTLMRCRLRAMAMAAAAARVTKRKGRPMFCLKKSGNTQAAPVRKGRTGPAAVLDVERCKRYRSEEHTSELQSLRHLVCR